MAVSVGSTWIVVSWQQDPLIDRYIITVSVGDGEIHVSVVVSGSESRTNVTGLLPSTEYTIVMVAVTMDGQISLPSAALTVFTAAPGTKVLQYSSLLPQQFILSPSIV